MMAVQCNQASVVLEVCPSEEELLSIEKNVMCTVPGCNQKFYHSGSLRMHLIKSHHKIENDKDQQFYQKQKKPNTDIMKFHCPVKNCTYQVGCRFFKSNKLLKQHYLKVHAEKRFACDKCGLKFGMERDRLRHQSHCGVLFHCGTCGCSYTTREALLTHCKRNNHQLCEEDKIEAKKRKDTRKNQMQNINKTESSIPANCSVPSILLVGIVSPSVLTPSVKKSGLRPIQPKPKVLGSVSLAMVSSMTKADERKEKFQFRNNAEVQTEIFGVHALALKKNCISRNNSRKSKHGQNGKVNGVTTGIQVCLSSPRRHDTCKTKTDKSPKRYSNSTGIQTSVSLVRQIEKKIVAGTQTSCTDILSAAMSSADLPVQHKSVGLQVTPPKLRPKRRMNMCSSETQTVFEIEGTLRKKRKRKLSDKGSGPVLIDSASQVSEGSYFSETCEIASQRSQRHSPESDLFSMATQTLHSYLENKKERSLVSQDNVEHEAFEASDSTITRVFQSNDVQINFNKIKINDSSFASSTTLHKSKHAFDYSEPIGVCMNLEKNQNILQLKDSCTEECKNSEDITMPKPVQQNTETADSQLVEQANTQYLNSSNEAYASLTATISVTNLHNITESVVLEYNKPSTNTIPALRFPYHSNESALPPDTVMLAESLLDLGRVAVNSQTSEATSAVFTHNVSQGSEISSSNTGDFTTATKDTISSQNDLQQKGAINYTTDSEVQTIETASDFDTLLESSGIMLQNSTGFTDIYTQTASELDFLDLLVNHMETQTCDDPCSFPGLELTDIQTQTLDLSEMSINHSLAYVSSVETQTSDSTYFLGQMEEGNFYESLGFEPVLSLTTAETQTSQNLVSEFDQTPGNVETQTSVNFSLNNSETQTSGNEHLLDMATADSHTQTYFDDLEELLFG
ncbi:hypothetical protein CHS0354_042891 [Potamilus streckersoni]|uniref:C2H2-type domain-containing protein n=1 Tax=Potamilus streckersoni TaxID=2493646 RepID=A0AAE0W7F5_9BIVA|nr:hypothetical protein CHS0354_042891 [Potamilus streckersoni]